MTVKAIACEFGTWALPADAPAYLKARDAERFAMVMTDVASDAWSRGVPPVDPSWAAVMATPLTPERVEYGATTEFTMVPA